MTRRISRGGGLPLERLLGLVEQPHVLDRDHRLVGEGLAAARAAFRSGASRARRSRIAISADGLSSRSSGMSVAGRAVPRDSRSSSRSSSARSEQVLDLDDADRPSRCSATSRATGSHPGCERREQLWPAHRRRFASGRARARRSSIVPVAAARSPRRRAGTAARRCRTIASNTGCTSVGELLMTLQDLARRGLLLERLLGLVEQPHVLDRDHRLVGEGLEQRDLLVGERRPRAAQHRDRADRARPRAASGRETWLRVAALAMAARATMRGTLVALRCPRCGPGRAR